MLRFVELTGRLRLRLCVSGGTHGLLDAPRLAVQSLLSRLQRARFLLHIAVGLLKTRAQLGHLRLGVPQLLLALSDALRHGLLAPVRRQLGLKLLDDRSAAFDLPLALCPLLDGQGVGCINSPVLLLRLLQTVARLGDALAPRIEDVLHLVVGAQYLALRALRESALGPRVRDAGHFGIRRADFRGLLPEFAQRLAQLRQHGILRPARRARRQGDIERHLAEAHGGALADALDVAEFRRHRHPVKQYQSGDAPLVVYGACPSIGDHDLGGEVIRAELDDRHMPPVTGRLLHAADVDPVTSDRVYPLYAPDVPQRLPDQAVALGSDLGQRPRQQIVVQAERPRADHHGQKNRR